MLFCPFFYLPPFPQLMRICIPAGQKYTLTEKINTEHIVMIWWTVCLCTITDVDQLLRCLAKKTAQITWFPLRACTCCVCFLVVVLVSKTVGQDIMLHSSAFTLPFFFFPPGVQNGCRPCGCNNFHVIWNPGVWHMNFLNTFKLSRCITPHPVSAGLSPAWLHRERRLRNVLSRLI